MNPNLIPCCYFPTTAVFVDDNPIFLEQLPFELEVGYARHGRYFKSPKEALSFLNHKAPQNPFLKAYVLQGEEGAYDHRTIEVNIPALHQEIFKPSRFCEVSTIVVDQVMPQMEGLQLCQQIANPYIKKIMLTGEADERFAIKAFNEGLIDHFVRKDSEEFRRELNSALSQMQQNYFQEVSRTIMSNLTIDERRACPLDDPAFVNFFKTLCQKEHIEEYYLLDSQGSFLLVDSNQNVRWFIVKTDDQLDHLASFAEEEDGPESVYAPLRQRSHLIYFYSDADSLTVPSNWHPFIYPIEGKLEGRHQYYYALLDSPQASEFEEGRVVYAKDYHAHVGA